MFVKPKHFSFVDPELEAVLTEEAEQFVITVKSKAYACFVGLDFKERDAIFSDSYFDLSAGVSRTVTVAKKISINQLRLRNCVPSLLYVPSLIFKKKVIFLLYPRLPISK